MEQPPHNRRRDFVAVALLAALALAFWGNCVFAGKVPVAAIYQKQMLPWSAVAAASSETRQWDSLLWDSMAQFYPWRLLLHRAAQSNELPLWNPYQFCGYPFVGNGQSAMFYPPNWLYFVVHPKVGLGLSAALHFFLGGVFVFGLARAWKLSVLPALFAALAFTYGGFMVTWIELPTLPNSLIWLPLAWWGIEVVCRSEGPRFSRPAVGGALMLAVALGMTLLAGHFQIAAYVWIFAFLYALIRPIAVARAASPARARIAPQCALAFALGLMLAMAQILPTLELGKYSSRGAGGPSAAGFEFHRQRALQPVELATLITPDFLGSPVTGDYPGISYSEHCGFVGAITLLLGIVGLVLKPRRKMAWLFGGIAVFALWGAMAGPPAMLLYWCVPKLGQAGGFPRLLSVWTLAAALWGAVGLQAIIESLRGGAVTVGRGLVPRRPLIAAVAVLLLLAQVLPWAYRFNPRAKAEDVYPETELIRQLRERLGSDRYVAINDRKAWGLTKVPTNVIMPPNAATVYGLRCVDGYDSLFPLSYRQFAAGLEGTDPSPPANGNMLLLGNDRLWAAKCLVTHDSMSPGNAAAWEGEGVKLMLAPPDRPRAQLWEVRSGPANSFMPSAPRFGPVAVPVSSEGMNAVRLDLRAAWPAAAKMPQLRTGWGLLLRDTYYPGWRVAFDGQAEPVGVPYECGTRPCLDPLATVDAFRALRPWDSVSTVDMAYFPASVACGLFVSLIALAAMVGLAVLMRGGGGRG